ncbi:hypothetical protein M899_1821 [Bacteriovorax sp. BSW11_IV]|uniref:hypothetical protein n=1 Tax=Bacteriovorax sp. BSW11_IV TaxID=1353529 RepID=UPI00038A2E0E|nr:hypothetical protein [Bacteriovorax sp. BSW11_IV]EQC43637.1 hypothetical protein M899_1821 [Bacteriovorax sp. BSW11_IV]
MSIRFGQLALYSKNKTELAHFLSELLEMEIKSAGEGVRLIADDISIIIFDDPRSNPANMNMMVDFFVDSKEELSELANKAQFFAYRFGLLAEGQDVGEIVGPIRGIGPLSYFFATDTDGRKWKFSHR